jgi:hypothetical protein
LRLLSLVVAEVEALEVSLTVLAVAVVALTTKF